MAIIYIGILTHGALLLENEYTPQINKIPTEIDYMNVISVAPKGIANIIFEKFTMINIKDILINVLSKSQPVGQPLANKIRDIYYDNIGGEINYFKNNPKNKYHSELYAYNDDKMFTSTDSNESIEYVDKLFTKYYIEREKEWDIYVLYQEGGQLKIGQELMLLIHKYFNLTTRQYDPNEINLFLSDVLKYLKDMGYKNIIIIDNSCQICRVLTSDYDYHLDVDTRSVRNIRRRIQREKYIGGKSRNKKKSKKSRKLSQTLSKRKFR